MRITPNQQTWLLGILAAANLSVSSSAAEVDLNPRRLVQWDERGGVHDVVYSTFRRIDRYGADGPGSWIYEWFAIGAFYAERAEAKEAAGDIVGAREDYLSASLYYSVARFPDNRSPEQRAAYVKHLDYYQKAGKYFDPPLQIVKTPFRGETVNGYLHLPKNVKRPPLIIWANGIDTHKADIYARLKHFTDRGIAVLTVDTIGTGENSQWPAAPGGEAMLQAVIDKMQNDKRVDGKRIGHIGISFGGHFAARLAAVEPRLKAVAALCAPVHEQFARGAEWYAQSESETTKALAAALRVDSGDFEAIAAAAAPLSLVDAGILGAGKTIKTPLLVANGDKDALVPLSDMTMLAEAAEHSDLWIMGGSGHCAGGYGARFYPNIAEWFLPYLSGDE